MMKRLQQLSVKTKVFDRRRTFITHTALNVERSGKASTSVANTYSEQECANSNNIDVEADDCEMSICGAHQAPGDEDSANTKRNISLFCNWEKLRPRIQRAFLEENCLNDDQICVLCLVQPLRSGVPTVDRDNIYAKPVHIHCTKKETSFT